MSRGEVYLIGSMDRSTGGAMIDRMIANGGPSPKIAISFAPVADSPEALKYMGERLLKLFTGACTVNRFSLAGEPHADPAAARAIIEEADLIFLSGGDPVLGARILLESGADAWIREARGRGAACAGISAGAIMLGAWWASWPDEHHPEAPFDGGKLIPCVGVVDDLVVDCHAEEDDWSELKLVAGMLREKGVAARLRGVPTRGGIVVGPDNSLEIVGDEPFDPSSVGRSI